MNMHEVRPVRLLNGRQRRRFKACCSCGLTFYTEQKGRRLTCQVCLDRARDDAMEHPDEAGHDKHIDG